jgi:hypothetical protein
MPDTKDGANVTDSRRDTVPAGPPVHTMTPEAIAQETLERVRSLEVVIRRMDSELAEHGKQLAERPAWADDIMLAVGNIEASKALQSRVALMGEEIAALQSGCDARHADEPIPSIVPRNGNGGA